jgi:hypothetical protein
MKIKKKVYQPTKGNSQYYFDADFVPSKKSILSDHFPYFKKKSV